MTTRKLTAKGIARVYANGNLKMVCYTSLNSRMMILKHIVETHESVRVKEISEMDLATTTEIAARWNASVRNSPMEWFVPREIVEAIKAAKLEIKAAGDSEFNPFN